MRWQEFTILCLLLSGCTSTTPIPQINPTVPQPPNPLTALINDVAMGCNYVLPSDDATALLVSYASQYYPGTVAAGAVCSAAAAGQNVVNGVVLHGHISSTPVPLLSRKKR